MPPTYQREYAYLLLNFLTYSQEDIKIEALKEIKISLSKSNPTGRVPKIAKTYGGLARKARNNLLQICNKETFEETVANHQKDTQDGVKSELGKPNNLIKIKTLLERINSSVTLIKKAKVRRGEESERLSQDDIVSGAKESDFESFSYNPIEFPDEFKPIPTKPYKGWGLKLQYESGKLTLAGIADGSMVKNDFLNQEITSINGQSLADFLQTQKKLNEENARQAGFSEEEIKNLQTSDLEFITHYFRTNNQIELRFGDKEIKLNKNDKRECSLNQNDDTQKFRATPLPTHGLSSTKRKLFSDLESVAVSSPSTKTQASNQAHKLESGLCHSTNSQH